ncbi:phospholipase D-like domain-containing protein [Pontibacter sp. 13R65]|uniref:phospholipase D-like domain-containing protein n=1 Tax=Pontibacter sp. 13R65 TaxID=3127458 RepID=UPI00301E393E
MQNFKFFILYVVLLIVTACNKENNPAPLDSGSGTATVLPVTISFPEAVFTNTDQVSQRIASTTIMDRLISLVDATPEKASIHVSIFGFDYPALVNALIRASNRGVKLLIMIDMSNDDTRKENAGTVARLKAALKAPSEVVIVTNDAGDIAINHNKFALFSEVKTKDGSAENIVFQASHNFTLADTRKVQDAIVLSHLGLYEAYASYWLDTREKAAKDMKYYAYREFSDATAGIYAYFLPKRKYGVFHGEDTIIEILNEIPNPSTATIRIGMSLWTDTRLNIVEKLDQLMDQGAKVEIISKPGIGEKVYAGLLKLEKKGANITMFSKTNIHSKFMLIEGTQDGASYNVIVAGNQNFTRNALRYNNEVILMLKNSELYQQYDDLFRELKELPE